MTRTRTVAALAASALVASGIGLTPAHAESRRTLPGSVPAWATAAHRVGSTPASQSITFRVYLGYRGGDAAAKLATAVSTPGSASYGKFLTPAQFRSQFAPDTATVDATKSWLTSQGFTVGTVPANHKYVEATGTVKQASAAFGTSFSEYSYQGHTLRSPSTALTIPSTLPDVQGVIGLDESQALLVHHTTTPGPAIFRNAQPCSDFWGQKTVQNTPTPDNTPLPASPSAFAPCGYAGAQLQGAYGMDKAIASGNNGKGVTVGIIDAYASPTIESDVNTYSSRHGLPSVTGHFRQVITPGSSNMPVNKQQDPQGWAGEETLDVEAVHTMAPGADIVYIGANNNYRDMDALMNKVVDNHYADIVSNSYGYAGESLPNGYIKPQVDTQIQAAAEGISLLFSSGDSGDETGGTAGATPSPDWPASSPWVTAVGGTSMGVDASNNRIFELGWETAKSTLGAGPTWNPAFYLYGSGGGTSRLFGQPPYQVGVVPDSIAKEYGGAAMRVVPDVAALGDPTTGMRVGETQTAPDGSQVYDEYRIGGTSLSSPLYAGMLALAEQKAGHEFGLANPLLYATRAASSDVTKAQLATYPGAVRVDFVNGYDASSGYKYSARWFDRDDFLTIHVRNGYDDVTGVGTPTGQAWLDAVSGK